jgi:hypothetical protein
MKICPYCGKQYPDEATVCPTDQQPLASSTESQKEARSIAPTGVACPACGATDDYKPAIELRGSFSLPVFLAGGILAILFRNAGRGRKVSCNKCAAQFYIRSPLSKISRVIFWLLVGPTIVAVIIFLLAMIGSVIWH